VKAIVSAYIRHQSDISLSTSGVDAEAASRCSRRCIIAIYIYIAIYNANSVDAALIVQRCCSFNGSTVAGRRKWLFLGDRKF